MEILFYTGAGTIGAELGEANSSCAWAQATSLATDGGDSQGFRPLENGGVRHPSSQAIAVD